MNELKKILGKEEYEKGLKDELIVLKTDLALAMKTGDRFGAMKIQERIEGLSDCR